jgi:hypothetical protein
MHLGTTDSKQHVHPKYCVRKRPDVEHEIGVVQMVTATFKVAAVAIRPEQRLPEQRLHDETIASLVRNNVFTVGVWTQEAAASVVQPACCCCPSQAYSAMDM